VGEICFLPVLCLEHIRRDSNPYRARIVTSRSTPAAPRYIAHNRCQNGRAGSLFTGLAPPCHRRGPIRGRLSVVLRNLP
jgi:hypothetical protein